MSVNQNLNGLHKRGLTSAIYDTTARRIITSGSDGKIKVLDGLSDRSPLEHVVGEKVNAICCRHDSVIVATEGNYVHILQIDDGLPDGMATRFTAGVNHLCLNKDGSKLVTCSSDFLIKVVDFSVSEGAQREFTLDGHKGAVLSVAFDPLDIFVASASCDGTVKIWRLDEKKEIKSLNVVGKCNDPLLASSYCRLTWESVCGKFLIIPVDREIWMYERHSWSLLCSLTCPSVTKPFMVCCNSCDGALIAGGSKDGWVIIWNIENRSILHRIRDPSQATISSLCWNPFQKTMLLYANENGSIGTISIPPDQSAPDDALSPRTMAELMGCDEDGDTEDLLNAAAAQAESSRLMETEMLDKNINGLPKKDGDENGDDDDDDVHSIDLSRIKSDYLSLNDDLDVLKPAPDVPTIPGEIQPGSTTGAPVVQTELKTQLPLARSQKPFQPGAMPLGFRERFMVWNRIGVVTQFRTASDDTIADETDFNALSNGSIEVEFHDTSLHHSLRLPNPLGYTMADLSCSALLLASPGSDDPSLADDADAGEQIEVADLSHVAVIPLDTSVAGGGDNTYEWSVDLPAGEACDAICLVSDTDCGYAVIATSRRFLRIFTQPSPSASNLRPSASLKLLQITKLGLPPVSIPGQSVVVMASHPTSPILAVVSSNLAGDLVWRVYYLGGIMLGTNRSKCPSWLSGSLASWQPLPLSPVIPDTISNQSHSYGSARLCWFGFSDTGGLFTHDSAGVVRRLLHTRPVPNPDLHWAPVLDTRRILKPTNRRSDNYFIVGVLESCESTSTELGPENRAQSNQVGVGHVQAIYCKVSKWPRVFPRPVVSNLSFQLPMCALGTDQGDLEENYYRCLLGEDWPVWGPNPMLPTSSQSESDLELCGILESLSGKCLTKRKAVLLRLFALAAKLESDWASLAVARLMPDAATVQLAIRYAGRLRRQNLAHRLAGIALEKEHSPQDSFDSPSPVKPVYSPPKSISRSQKRNPVSPSSPKYRAHMADHRSTYAYDTEDNEAMNASIVSSATDDTREEGHISSLPLPESESMSQSTLDTQTSSSSRNPFKFAGSNSSKQKTNRDSDVQGRGSAILDSWKPKPADLSSNGNTKLVRKSASLPKKRAVEQKKLRTKPASTAETEHTDNTNNEQFIDWFEENREMFEENYPEKSVEELIQIARAEFKKFKSTNDGTSTVGNREPTGTDDECSQDKENLSHKSCKRPMDPSLQDSDLHPKKRPSGFAEKASKRLSNFKFDHELTE